MIHQSKLGEKEMHHIYGGRRKNENTDFRDIGLQKISWKVFGMI